MLLNTNNRISAIIPHTDDTMLNSTDKKLIAIPGLPPDPAHLPEGDAFAERNAYALAIDYKKEPPCFTLSETHQARTWLLDPRAPEVTNPFTRGNPE